MKIKKGKVISKRVVRRPLSVVVVVRRRPSSPSSSSVVVRRRRSSVVRRRRRCPSSVVIRRRPSLTFSPGVIKWSFLGQILAQSTENIWFMTASPREMFVRVWKGGFIEDLLSL